MSEGRLMFLGDVVALDEIFIQGGIGLEVVMNLECPITRSVTVAEKKVLLRSENDWATRAFGKLLRVACLANNHIMDYGAQGLEDTVAILDAADVAWFGAGKGVESVRNDLVLQFGQMKVGFCGYVCSSTHPVFASSTSAGVLPVCLARIGTQIASLRRKGADRVVVCLHWGEEDIPYPKPSDVLVARAIAKMGADLIIGHHSHCVQPWEVCNGCPIFYGLGNAIMPDLDVPCDCHADYGSRRRYVKTQRSWNLASIGVEYNIYTKKVRVRRLRFDRESLSFDMSLSEGSGILGRELKWIGLAYPWWRAYGRIRSLLVEFVARPRLPRIRHFTGVFR